MASDPPATQRQQSVDMRRMIAFMGMVFGMFMAILDIQIVSASLADIQAGLSASSDEISWVQTSYLIAEVVMIPLSGFLARAFSTRWLFTVSAAGFTLMSLACALSTNIEQMIVFRALQGFIGGGMIPSVFVAAYTVFPPSKRGFVAPLVGLVATLAPTIGPTAGGYLTDLFSWHWLFLINVFPGVVVALVAWFMIDFDQPDLALLRNFDWLGLISMALFLGALEYVLEEGPSKNWFEENVIVWGAILSLSGAVVFFSRAFTSKNPIVDLTAFANRNFWMSSLATFVLGIGLYGLTYVYPVFLARVRGYSSLQIGETMFVTGLCQFMTAPVIGRLMQKIDARVLIAIGFSGFSFSSYLATFITKDWGFSNLLLPQILRGVSLMICMIPINNMAMGTMPPNRIKNASGLFNLMRNLGGAVGLAIINTVLIDREALHYSRISESLHWGNATAEETLERLSQVYRYSTEDPARAALSRLVGMVHRDAMVMAVADVFFLVAVLFIAMLTLAPLMQRPTTQPGPDAAH